MEPAVIIMMLSVFFLLLSITVGLYSLFCGLSAAGDVRRMRNSTALRTGESDDKDKKAPTPLPRLAEAGIEVNGKTWIFLLVLLAGAGGLIGFMALGLIGIGFALIGPLIAELWVRSRGKSRKARFDEQLARSLPMVAENMRAGSSIERALRSVGENSDDPLKSELLACAGAMQIDGDIVAALDDMAKRTGSKDLVLLQAAVASHKGGVSNRITGIKIWLEGDIAKEYDIAYRAFIYGQGWTERFHSNGGSQDDAELCGSDDASGSKGAIKCIQVFAIPKPRGAKLAREFAEDNSFIPESSHSGGYLTAQAMLALNLDDTSGFDGHKMIADAYQGDSSKGLEALPVPPTPPPPVGIKVFYYVDGETDPCFEEEYEMGTTYQVNPDATAAGQKDNCLDLVCWYTDPEYTQPYEPTELSTALKLYGYNPCSVKYDTTTRSSVLDTSYNWSTDADLGTALDLSALYPQDEIVKYGTKLTFAGPWSAWCEDAGKTRCVSSTPGVYATAGASGSPILSATIKGNTTVYVDWPWSGYDGVMSARS